MKMLRNKVRERERERETGVNLHFASYVSMLQKCRKQKGQKKKPFVM